MPSVRERLAGVGGTVARPERRSPEYLGQFMRREVEKWAGPHQGERRFDGLGDAHGATKGFFLGAGHSGPRMARCDA
jgi:hypothetical protein